LKKLKFILSSIWIMIIGLISPLWVGGIYMFITGHGKGYAYDLGSEADISIFIGFILLLIWLAAIVPIMLWSCRKWFNMKGFFALIPVMIFIICFILSIFLVGTDEFQRQFGLL
jgi:hypothetical protein